MKIEKVLLTQEEFEELYNKYGTDPDVIVNFEDVDKRRYVVVQEDDTKIPVCYYLTGPAKEGTILHANRGHMIVKIAKRDDGFYIYKDPKRKGLKVSSEAETLLAPIFDVEANKTRFKELWENREKGTFGFSLIHPTAAGDTLDADPAVVDPVDVDPPVAPSAPAIGVIYSRIALPPKKGSANRIPAHLIYAPSLESNAGDEFGNSLYLLPKKSDAPFDESKLTDPKYIIDNGGVVVNRIRYDKNAQLRIKYYEAQDKLAFRYMKAVDLDGEVHDKVTEVYGTDTKKVSKIRPSIKSRVALAIVAGVMLVSLTLSTFAFVGPDQTEKAKTKARTQVTLRMDALEGTELFLYKDGKPVRANGLYNITNNKFATVRQDTLFGFMKKYPDATIQGAATSIGAKAAEELINKNVAIAIFNPDTQEYETRYYYAVDTNKKEESLLKREDMIEYLKGVGYTDQQAEVFVSSYEEGYARFVEQALAKDLSIGKENQTPPQNNQPSNPPIVKEDLIYEGEDFTNAVVEAIKNATKKQIAEEDIEVVYASNEEQKIFVTAGNFMYELNLAAQSATNSEFVEQIETATVKESVNANHLLKQLNVSETLLKSYITKNGADQVYVQDYMLNDDFSVTPTVVIVKDGGETVVVRNLSKVIMDDVTNGSIAEMNAVALFDGKYVSEDATYTIVDTTTTETVYEDSEIATAEDSVENEIENNNQNNIQNGTEVETTTENTIGEDGKTM
ncbi:MAG: hypothetical protein E7375_03995 [Clostridiales bacterium]|nr:hypothetical protein [Clostridiales bacterium]